MKKVLILFLLVTLLTGISTLVYATDDNVTFTASSTNVYVGDSITVTLKTAQAIQATDFNINYTSDCLEFVSTSVSEGHYTTANAGVVKVSTYNTNGMDSFSFTFKVIKAGNITFSTDIENLYIDQNDENVLAFENKELSVTATSKSQEYDENDDNNDVDSLIWTDFSNANFNIEIECADGSQYCFVNMYNTDYIDGHSYWALIINESTGITEDMIKSDGESFNESDMPNIKDSIIELNSDIYMYILEEQYDDNNNYFYKIVVNAKKLERISEPALGSRIICYFQDDYASSYIYVPCTSDRKINYKIGIINDTSILKSIMNGESDCLSKLLSYAKSATNGKTGTISIGDSDSITESLGLIDGAYYYVYLELEDENGKYYPVEDVSLYQASVGSSVGANLYDYLSDSFKWNLDDEGTNDEENSKDTTVATTSLPQTGETILIFVTILTVIGISAVSIINYRKYRDI